MRGPHFILLLIGSIVLTLSGCSRTERTFSSFVQCYTDYDDIDITLTNEATGETNALNIEENGSVHFIELPEDHHTLRTVVDPGSVPYPTFESTHRFVPSDESVDFFVIPTIVEVVEVVLGFDEGITTLSGEFVNTQCLQVDSMYAYVSSDWPFELTADNLHSASRNQFESEFSLPVQDSTFHVVFEFVSNRNGRRAVTRSEHIHASLAELKLQKLELDVRHDFELEEGDNFWFEADLVKGQLYLIEF